MVKDRLMRPGLLPPRAFFFASLMTILVAGPSRGAAPPVKLSDAGQSGVFNVAGAGQVTVNKSTEAGEDALKVDYTLPPGSAAGVWAKAFPKGLDEAHLDLIEVGIKGAGTGLNASLEIKGSAGTQKIPLAFEADWIRSELPIDWKAIGTVTEVVLSLGQVGAEPASGSLWLDVRFAHESGFRKLMASMPGRMLVALAVSLLLALGMGLVRVVGPSGEAREATGFRRDFAHGLGTVLIVVVGLMIYEFGGKLGADARWVAAVIVVAVAAVAHWKFWLSGRLMTPAEVLQDALAVGLLASTSSPMEILQAPAHWAEAIQLGQFAAAVAAFGYLAFVANRLATTARHPGGIAAGLIVGAPYAVGSLVLLSSTARMQELGGLVFGGWAEPSAFLGRVVVLFAFNEALANGLALATKRKGLTSIRVHLALLLVAIAAIAGPPIADYGSSAVVGGWGPWGSSSSRW